MAKKVTMQGDSDPHNRVVTWVESVTKDRAIALLSSNHERQRSITKSTVDKYVAEMRAGRWTFSPQGIVLDKNGKMIDGQHRMEALRVYGEPLPFMFFQCSSDDVMSAIDRGKARTDGNLLEMSGSVQKGRGALVSSICKAFYHFQRNMVYNHDFSATLPRILGSVGKDIESLISLVGSRGRTPASVLAAYVYARQAYPEEATEFILRVKDNNALSMHSGAWHLRRILDAKKVLRGDGYIDLTHRALKCIQLEIQGKTAALLRIDFESNSKVPFSESESVLFYKKAREARGLSVNVY